MKKKLPLGSRISVIPFILFFIIFSGIQNENSYAQAIPAFPGAEGFGSKTPGGRGGMVLFVTNLNDAGPGSFRDACEASGPRIVIFRVTGTIFLDEAILVGNPYLTIAGQTAPGGGICLANEPLRIKTHDVIIRGLRSRAGDLTGYQHPLEIESLNLIGDTDDNLVYNVIVDHCSFSWGLDKNVGYWGPDDGFGVALHDLTIQWCISSEALHSRFHPKGNEHAYGLFFSSAKNVSAHHNLLAHNHARQPQFSRTTEGEGINNVIYNYGQFGTEVQSGSKISLIGNYYKTGGDWSGRSLGINVGEIEPPFGAVSVYVDGNIGPGRPTDEGDDWNAVTGDERYRSFSPPVPLSGVAALSPTDAYDLVLESAGAFPRDAVDLRIVSDVINGTGEVISSQTDVGGWPTLAHGTPPTDTDNDGMPDEWEIQNGLNPNNPADGNGDQDGDGYTNVEEYINSLIGEPTGGGSGEPPVVSNIPNQAVTLPERFAPIKLDDYVSDPDNDDTEITWSWTGNTDLIVQWNAAKRGVRIQIPNGWTGSETITFTATDPDGNSDSDNARFSVSAPAGPQVPSGMSQEGTGGTPDRQVEGLRLPASTALLGNYPNPFNPTTTIRYQLAEGMHVSLKVFDILGKEVRTLVDGFVPAGYHESLFDASDLVSGIYFYRLTTPSSTEMKRLLLVK